MTFSIQKIGDDMKKEIIENKKKIEELEEEISKIRKITEMNFKRITVFFSEENFLLLQKIREEEEISINKILNFWLMDFWDFKVSEDEKILKIVKRESDGLNGYTKLLHKQFRGYYHENNIKIFKNSLVLFTSFEYQKTELRKTLKPKKINFRISEENFLFLQRLKNEYNLKPSEIFSLIMEDNFIQYLRSYKNSQIFSILKRVNTNLGQIIKILERKNLDYEYINEYRQKILNILGIE